MSASVSVNVVLGNAPVAVITGPASAWVGDPVRLDGSGSHDAMGRPLTYSWKLLAGPAATLAAIDTASPAFVPAVNGIYDFQLVVSNGLQTSQPATYKIAVQNYPTLRGGGCDAASGTGLLSLIGLLGVRRRTRRKSG